MPQHRRYCTGNQHTRIESINSADYFTLYARREATNRCRPNACIITHRPAAAALRATLSALGRSNGASECRPGSDIRPHLLDQRRRGACLEHRCERGGEIHPICEMRWPVGASTEVTVTLPAKSIAICGYMYRSFQATCRLMGNYKNPAKTA